MPKLLVTGPISTASCRYSSRLTCHVFCLLVAACLAAAGCQNDSAPNSGQAPAANNNQPRANSNAAAETGLIPTPEPGDASSEDFEGTVRIVEKKRPGIALAVLRQVRTARHANFDRVVFEFEGAAPPGYHVEYIDKPVRECGSGDTVPLAGDAWLRVRFVPAQAHTEAGEATVKDRERRFNLPVLKELKAICDFEADVEWVLGLSAPNRYRVLELADPARVVVDVKH